MRAVWMDAMAAGIGEHPLDGPKFATDVVAVVVVVVAVVAGAAAGIVVVC